MLTRKRINLLFSITLVVSLLVLIAGTYNIGGTDASAQMMKSKVLRRKDQMKLKPRLDEIRAFQEGREERTFKAREFKDMPLVIRQVRNLQSETWHKDLEIEVKNVSSKPIYFILAYLQFPDVPVPADGVYGIALEFGNRRNLDYRKDSDPQDPHLNPGEKFTFTIPESMKKGIRVQHERSPELMKRIELHFSVISFGDGTGFVAERPRAREKRSHSIRKNHSSNRLEKSASTEPPPQDGCGTCSRYIMDQQQYVICYSGGPCFSNLATTSSDQPCTLTRPNNFPCGEVQCHHDEIYESPACPGYSPTPTPTPTPSPIPSPTPTPEPCIPGVCMDDNPIAVQVDNCNQDYSAGCPNGYTRSSNCCYPPCPLPTPTPPSCPGGLLIRPSRLTFCNWICIKRTLTDGSGGGEGNEPGDAIENCNNYYWVWFSSSDGGQTWTATGQVDDAGCW